MRALRTILAFVFCVYLVPGLAAAGIWAARERPANWREAKWASSELLPDPAKSREARVTIFAAKTGGMKGAFAVHSWIVLKPKDGARFDRYDVVGWGQPVRRNGYEPDGYWYSNAPQTVWEASGTEAERLIPKIEAAIEAYPHNQRGAYRMWPGPNSNSFVAHILRTVPEIDAVLPPNAVGRDYLSDGGFYHFDPAGDLNLTLYGLFGISAGMKSGFEMHLFGLVAGVDFRRPAIKIPAFGRIGS
ncbi:MAG: DUF3750 domain-containing protein [Rhizobium sp.]|jgi:hypothetical protein|nr:DUF3750 domain-containing protein [Rhizobium sp.]